LTAELRIVVVSLATFAAVGLLLTALVPFAARWTAGEPVVRARRLASLRLLPTIVALAASAVVFAAFIAFEPWRDGEEITGLAPGLAALAVVLLASAAWRGLRLARATRHTIDIWMRTAEPVSLPGISAPVFTVHADFPIVAVVGFARPRLIIARSVLETCSPSELEAVLAHEQGHINRRDNLRRLLLSVAPDVLAWLPASERLFAAWRDAAEEAADDDAVRAGADGRVRLASALVKVARLAPASDASPLMPASALYRGESLDRRVRRLLEIREAATAPAGSRWRSPFVAAAGAVLSLAMLEEVHAVVEGLLHRLP
jgi:Zn-dependent protease with chaperone function